MRLRPTGSTVVVADAQTHTALCVARSLSRAGHRVVAVGAGAAGALRSSAAARAERLTCPEAGYADAVVEVARREGAAAILGHFETTLLALHARVPGDRPVVVSASPELLALCERKSTMLEAARRAGVAVPATVVVDSGMPEGAVRAEARALAQDRGWPIFAKGDSERGVPPGFGSRYVVLRGEPDLEGLPAFVRARGRVLLQEEVAGRGCGIAGLFRDGVPACVGGHVRLREAHASGGVSTYCEARIVPEALRAASALLAEVGWSGVAMVEFKLPREGPPVLMEVNPRLWGSLPLYVHAGADVPLAALRHALGDAMPPPRPFAEGRRMRFLLSDLAAIRRQYRGPRRLAELALAVATTPLLVPDATFSLRDPLPFLFDVRGQVARSVARRLRPAASR